MLLPLLPRSLSRAPTAAVLALRVSHMSIMSKALHRIEIQKEKEEKRMKESAKEKPKIEYEPAGIDQMLPKFIEPDEPKNAKALDIAIVGLPNAGKSTLVNRLMGKKISIVSPKVQTTRKQIQAVLTVDNTQLRLVDTPGIVPPAETKKLNRELVTVAWQALDMVDYVVVIVDAAKRNNELEIKLLDELRERKSLKTCLVLNKTDYVVPKSDLLPISEKYFALLPKTEEVFMTSALRNDGVDALRNFLLSKAKRGMWTHHSSIDSDLSDLTQVEEIIREKILLRSNKEVPYSVTQENVGWREENGVVSIIQNISVDRIGQKTILLGPKGENIQWIRDAAARDISQALNKEVRLRLVLKVRGKGKEMML